MEYHVAKTGSDGNAGTAAAPFLTISAAASVAKAGDVITVHAGMYRERVSPVEGGTAKARIVYQAAPDEHVIIKGSEVVTGWEPETPCVWRVTLPNSFFGEFNPFKELIQGDWFNPLQREHHRGDVYLNGNSLFEAESIDQVMNPTPHEKAVYPERALRCWHAEVSDQSTTIRANFGAANPNESLVEINVRAMCFAPKVAGVDYITVRGFEMCHAATQWAPPTEEQMGLLWPRWSKGWIIEDNVIHDSRCTGISLGKDHETGYRIGLDRDTKNGTQRQREVVCEAARQGWSRETTGSHIVRRNTIYDCEQTGICGHLGCIFSIIEDNHIHDIFIKRLFQGEEIGGIKLHTAIDTLIQRNHIHNCYRALWLDWQAQGSRVTRNLFYDSDEHDLYIEVNHGPCLIDNNVLLSPVTLLNVSCGTAYIHNLIAGHFTCWMDHTRFTPYHYPHATDIAGFMMMLGGDDRFANNLFIQNVDIIDEHPKFEGIPDDVGLGADRGLRVGTYQYNGCPREDDAWYKGALSPEQYVKLNLPVKLANNVYLKGAEACQKETGALEMNDCDPKLTVEAKRDRVTLSLELPEAVVTKACERIDTAWLGKAFQPEMPFENPDGSPLVIDEDYQGRMRTESPKVGPFEDIKTGLNQWVVWQST